MRKILALLLCACLGAGAFSFAAAEGDAWEVIQYADASGNQGMFYSLRNLRDGTVILVDSGNPENADTVRQAVRDLGGHVDAWFLTHYHPDHIGAFNLVWDELKEEIGQIYVTPVDYETYLSAAHEWDQPAVFAAFLEHMQGVNCVDFLYRGNELEIGGLQVRILNAFDSHVKELSTDWCNDCSLVIRIQAEKESILFLGDLSRAGVPLAEYILEEFGAENVRADYVQGGHHGNWGLPVSWYGKIMPKVFLFNAPEWLMTGEAYDAKDTEAWCKEHGIETHDYREGNVRFVLR